MTPARLSHARKQLIATLAPQGVAQGLSLAAALILARLYGPEDFGAYAVYISGSTMLGSLACARLEVLIPLGTSPRHARALVGLCFGLCIALATLVCLVTLGIRFAPSLGLPPVRFSEGVMLALPWTGLGMLGMGICAVQCQMLIKQGRPQLIPSARCCQVVVAFLFQWLMQRRAQDATHLITGDILGRAVEVGFLYVASRSHMPRLRMPAILAHWRVLLRQHRRFLLTSAPSSVINTVAVYCPPILVESFHGLAAVGLFNLAQRALNVPTATFTQATSRVYTAQLSRSLREGDGSSEQIFRYMLKRCVVVGVPALAAIAAFAPWGIPWLLGAKWAPAIPIFMAMLPLALAQLVTGSVATTLYCVGRYEWELCWNSLRLLTVGATLSLPALFQASILSTVVLFSLSTGLLYAALLAVSYLAIQTLHPSRRVNPMPAA